jgi:SAM-dependent methyltransferase
MRPRAVASAIKGALLAAIEERASRSSAMLALERARSLVGASRRIQFDAKPAEPEDDIAEMWFPHVGSDRVRRANEAFLARIPAEFDALFQHSREVKDRSIPSWVYAELATIQDHKVLEVACGPGELAKRLAPLAKAWVGIDESNAALKLARLVSPENAVFVHPSQHVSLAVHHGSVDTVIGRGLFVHQNLEEAREMLGFLAPFLVTGGRLYAELFFPNPEIGRERVYPAAHPPAGRDALFAYSRANVDALIQKRPFLVSHDEERPDIERRYVILRKTEVED